MELPSPSDEILLELIPVGNFVRVAAINSRTLTEVIFQVPLATDRTTLAAMARRKLAFVESRKNRGG